MASFEVAGFHLFSQAKCVKRSHFIDLFFKANFYTFFAKFFSFFFATILALFFLVKFFEKAFSFGQAFLLGQKKRLWWERPDLNRGRSVIRNLTQKFFFFPNFSFTKKKVGPNAES